ncbi:MAG: hypothetical protein IID01_15390, partial [Chloroflexi bacterium]|nr:hypothetical protein [Chloroflexota bacterium]
PNGMDIEYLNSISTGTAFVVYGPNGMDVAGATDADVWLIRGPDTSEWTG